MKKAIGIFFISCFFISCLDKITEDAPVPSTGKTNSLTVIISDQLWNSEIGDSIRKKFAAPVDGLPQEEPLFTINQYPIKVLDGYKTISRNILIVKKEDRNSFRITENEFAIPQNVVRISGNRVAVILKSIEENADLIIDKFKETEIRETQKSFNLALLDDIKIRDKFKIALKLPAQYKYVLEGTDFLWLKKEILSGNNSILIYSVPASRLLQPDNPIDNIIKIRDSIGALYIHSKVESTKMITEESYSPYFYATSLKGRQAFETKGTWEIRGDFMSGAFLNYAIFDKDRDRYIVIEGFCYAPSTNKRDLMHEAEAIIKSVTFL